MGNIGGMFTLKLDGCYLQIIETTKKNPNLEEVKNAILLDLQYLECAIWPKASSYTQTTDLQIILCLIQDTG